MRIAWHTAALLGFLTALAACTSASAPEPQALKDFDFDQPCISIPDALREKGFSVRGDPQKGDTQITFHVTHPLFWVVEVRCAPLPGPDGDRMLFPVEMIFFSGGKDEGGRITRGATTLGTLLSEKLKMAPWKNLQTARWESSSWTGGLDLVRHYETGPADSKDLKVVLLRYPSNTPEQLEAHLKVFLEILKDHPLPPSGE